MLHRDISFHPPHPRRAAFCNTARTLRFATVERMILRGMCRSRAADKRSHAKTQRRKDKAAKKTGERRSFFFAALSLRLCVFA
jgi:hypothetical protein